MWLHQSYATIAYLISTAVTKRVIFLQLEEFSSFFTPVTSQTLLTPHCLKNTISMILLSPSLTNVAPLTPQLLQLHC